MPTCCSPSFDQRRIRWPSFHLGAREYDQAIGAFVSVDPVFDRNDLLSRNDYAHADDSPTINSDPAGTVCLEECGSADDRIFQATARGKG